MTSHGSRYARIHFTELLRSTHRCLITIHSHPTKALVSPKDAALLESLEASEQPERQELPQRNTTPTPPTAPTQRDILVLSALLWHSQHRLHPDQSPPHADLHAHCVVYLEALKPPIPTK